MTDIEGEWERERKIKVDCERDRARKGERGHRERVCERQRKREIVREIEGEDLKICIFWWSDNVNSINLFLAINIRFNIFKVPFSNTDREIDN